MSDDKDTHRTPNDAEQEMVGKPPKIDAAKIALANGKRRGLLCGVCDKPPKLGVKVVGKLLTGDSLVIVHDRVNVGMNSRMQDDSHQRRRSRTLWSS